MCWLKVVGLLCLGIGCGGMDTSIATFAPGLASSETREVRRVPGGSSFVVTQKENNSGYLVLYDVVAKTMLGKVDVQGVTDGLDAGECAKLPSSVSTPFTHCVIVPTWSGAQSVLIPGLEKVDEVQAMYVKAAAVAQGMCYFSANSVLYVYDCSNASTATQTQLSASVEPKKLVAAGYFLLMLVGKTVHVVNIMSPTIPTTTDRIFSTYAVVDLVYVYPYLHVLTIDAVIVCDFDGFSPAIVPKVQIKLSNSPATGIAASSNLIAVRYDAAPIELLIVQDVTQPVRGNADVVATTLDVYQSTVLVGEKSTALLKTVDAKHDGPIPDVSGFVTLLNQNPTSAPDTNPPPTPAPPTRAPPTRAPPTLAPPTPAPPTPAPPTPAPPTRAPPTLAPQTEVPETKAPRTDAPKTDAPDTDVPKTESPQTEAPRTHAPMTKTPKTDVPDTDAPKTDAPDTDVPKTESPPTEAPRTHAPMTKTPMTKTDVPNTDVPMTESPRTEAPRTVSPPTPAPPLPHLTMAPRTESPPNLPPPTVSPRTEAPKTELTVSPRTEAPRTEAPSTASPPKVSPTLVPSVAMTLPPTHSTMAPETPPTQAPLTLMPTTDPGPTEAPATRATLQTPEPVSSKTPGLELTDTDLPTGSSFAPPTPLPIGETYAPTDVPETSVPDTDLPAGSTFAPPTPLPVGATYAPSSPLATPLPPLRTLQPLTQSPNPLSQQCLAELPEKPGVFVTVNTAADQAKIQMTIAADMGVTCGCAGVQLDAHLHEDNVFMGIGSVEGCPAANAVDDALVRTLRVLMRFTLSRTCSAADVAAAKIASADDIVFETKTSSLLSSIASVTPQWGKDAPLTGSVVLGGRVSMTAGELAAYVEDVLAQSRGYISIGKCKVAEVNVYPVGPSTRCRVEFAPTVNTPSSLNFNKTIIGGMLGVSPARILDVYTASTPFRFTYRDPLGESTADTLCARVTTYLGSATSLTVLSTTPSEPPRLVKYRLAQQTRIDTALVDRTQDLGNALGVAPSSIQNIEYVDDLKYHNVLDVTMFLYDADVPAFEARLPYDIISSEALIAQDKVYKGKVIGSKLDAASLAMAARVLDADVYVHSNGEFAFKTLSPTAGPTIGDVADKLRATLEKRYNTTIRSVLLQEATREEAFLMDLCKRMGHGLTIGSETLCTSCPPVLSPVDLSVAFISKDAPSPSPPKEEDEKESGSMAKAVLISLICTALLTTLAFLGVFKYLKIREEKLLASDLVYDTESEYTFRNRGDSYKSTVSTTGRGSF